MTVPVRVGRAFFRYREALFPLVLIPLFLLFSPRYPGDNEQYDTWMDAIGLLLALTGQGLRAAVIGYVYILRGGRDRRVYAEDLVTSGFFAHARNPLYLGNLLILLGLFLIHGNPWVLGIGALIFLVAYVTIVAAEEDYLASRFGDAYAAYARKVPRWVPRLRGLGESLEGMRFNWKRVVAKEYSSAFVWMGGAVLLMTQDILTYHAYGERRTQLAWHWAALGVLAAGWAGARILKKTGRLKGPQQEAA